MAKLHAYLNFNGNCAEAFDFYKSVFGTEYIAVMRYGDMPGEGLPETAKEKIMNIALPIHENTLLLGSDTVEGLSPKTVFGTNTYLMLDCATADEARSLYEKLSDNAQNIEMELNEQFWAELFASFVDRFGIAWMINFDGVKKIY